MGMAESVCPFLKVMSIIYCHKNGHARNNDRGRARWPRARSRLHALARGRRHDATAGPEVPPEPGSDMRFHDDADAPSHLLINISSIYPPNVANWGPQCRVSHIASVEYKIESIHNRRDPREINRTFGGTPHIVNDLISQWHLKPIIHIAPLHYTDFRRSSRSSRWNYNHVNFARVDAAFASLRSKRPSRIWRRKSTILPFHMLFR